MSGCQDNKCSLIAEQTKAMGSLIREIPTHDRPRERLERLGTQSLTDAELLAILLRTGRRGMSAIQLGESLLKEFGGLEELARSTIFEIMRVNGIGRAKAALLRAAFDMHERVNCRSMQDYPIDNPDRIYNLMFERIRFLKVEVLYALALDSKLRLIHFYEISRGLLDQTLIHARETFRQAISASAAYLVLVHNHPSGDPKPSVDDIKTTREMVKAGEVLGISLLDHVIIGKPSDSHPKGYLSLKQLGIIEKT